MQQENNIKGLVQHLDCLVQIRTNNMAELDALHDCMAAVRDCELSPMSD